jgi:hypothetical protein
MSSRFLQDGHSRSSRPQVSIIGPRMRPRRIQVLGSTLTAGARNRRRVADGRSLPFSVQEDPFPLNGAASTYELGASAMTPCTRSG